MLMLRYHHTPLPTTTSATALAAVRPLAVCGGVSGTLRCLLLQQLATADTLVTPDTVYKMYGVTQQQSCV